MGHEIELGARIDPVRPIVCRAMSCRFTLQLHLGASPFMTASQSVFARFLFETAGWVGATTFRFFCAGAFKSEISGFGNLRIRLEICESGWSGSRLLDEKLIG